MQQLAVIFSPCFSPNWATRQKSPLCFFATSKEHHPFLIFLAASLALVASTTIAVVLGTAAERYLTMMPSKLIAGIGFLLIGAWTIWDHVQTA